MTMKGQISFMMSLSILLITSILEHSVNCQMSFRSMPRTPACSRKCRGNSVKSYDELYYCSCSSSCQIYGDCCSDAAYQNKDPSSKSQFVCLAIEGRSSVQAVAGCPPGKPSNVCKEAIGHLPPVTNKVTNITYANVFCAMCNDDDANLFTWNVELKCCPELVNASGTPLMNTNSIYVHGGYIWTDRSYRNGSCPCTYHAHYGDYTVIDSLELRFCGTQERTSKCLFTFVSTMTEKLCWSYIDPVYFDKKLFRNLHCAACNDVSNLNGFECMPESGTENLHQLGADTYIKKYLCNKLGYEACIDFFNGQRKGVDFALGDMYTMYSQKKRKTTIQARKNKCPPNQLLDPLSKRCKTPRKGGIFPIKQNN